MLPKNLLLHSIKRNEKKDHLEHHKTLKGH